MYELHFAETCYLMFCFKEDAASFSEILISPTNLHGVASQTDRNLLLIQTYTGIYSGLFSNVANVNT